MSYSAATLIAAVIAISAAVSAAQMAPDCSPAPAPSVDCSSELLSLSDCLSYVLVGSQETKPAKSCCSELAGLVESYPNCLCTLFTLNASSYGLEVDYGRAFGLPSSCSVTVPPSVTACAREANATTQVGAPSPSQGGGGGGSSPAASPAGGGGMMGPPPANSEAGSGSDSGGSSHGSPKPISKFAMELFFTGATTGFLLLLW
ncbi:Non-specific lipid transfer protein GPI-anchored 11 [Linum perenne]